MILADSSVWVDHLRAPNPLLADLLRRRRLRIHPMVVGELALGSLKDRARTLAALTDLRPVAMALHEEVMHLIESAGLYASGLGYVDANLLASARITRGCRLWTRDKRLQAVAERLGLFEEPARRAGEPDARGA